VVASEGEDDAEVVGTPMTFVSTMVGACEDMDGLADEGGREVVTLVLSTKMSF